jgi:hypothetical protein
MLDALRESAADVSMVFNIWYNQQLVYPNVPATSWSINWDKTRQTKGQGTFTFLDPDAKLLPWGYEDPLSVGGGMVQSKLICGSSSVDLAFQRITRSEPAESWRLYQPGGVKTWVAGTHTIAIQADDLTTVVSANRFLAPETPAAGATVFGELARVCKPFMNVVIDGALTDRPVPATVVYKGDRMATVQQLADAIGAGLRVTGGGQLSVYAPQTTSVWTVKGGDHDANLVTAKRSALYAGLYNAVVSRTVLSNGAELQAVVVQRGGPLDWDGPHGHVPYEHQANFATDQSSVQADATTMLQSIIKSRSSTIPFTAKIHPGIETGDPVTLMMPIFDGTEWPLPGTISSVTIGGNGNVGATMDYTVDVLDTDIAAIAAINKKKKYLG